jgi:ribose-phosphate pyrophosphokinase
VTEPFAVFAFDDTQDLARAVATRLELDVQPVGIHRFPDGESLVRAVGTHAPRAVLFRSLDHPNEKLVELLLAADALRQQGVKRIGLVAPYLGYMRQDRVFQSGEPISQRVIARLLDFAFDEILTVEAHLHRIQSLSEIFSCPARSISAAGPIAGWLRDQENSDVVIGPDAESEAWIRSVAEQADLDWIVSSKTRHGDRDVSIDVPGLPRDARTAWIVDDIASSGATLESIVRILKSRGVETVGAIIVHALFDDAVAARLASAGLDRLVSSDSVPHASNAISLAALLADALCSDERSSEGT